MNLKRCGRCFNSILLSRDFIIGQGDLFPFDNKVVFPRLEGSTVGQNQTHFDPNVTATEVDFCFDNASSGIVA